MSESDNIPRRRRPGEQPYRLMGVVALLLLCAACTQPEAEHAVTVDSTGAPRSVPHAPPAAEAEPDSRAGGVPAEHLIVPGVRMGRVTWTTTREELLRAYGAAYVDSTVHVGEGETRSGALVAAGTDSAFAVLWGDPERAHVSEVRVLGPVFRTAEGVRLGSTLAELEAAAGIVDVLGMSWDYAGTVLLEKTRWAHYAGLLILRMRPSQAGRASPAYGRVRGDRPYRSDSPDVRALELTVGEVIVRLKPGG